MLATGEKKILYRHNRGQRVAAAKQLLVPSATSDSASLNVKVDTFLFQSHLTIRVLCYSCSCKSFYIQGGPEKTAQTLMRYNFSTAGHRVTRFPAKCSESNW